MCPKCCANAFSKERLGPNHISPRFGNCRKWEFTINGMDASNAYEVLAGEKGWVWFYIADSACGCGSGFPTFEFLSAKVEAHHPAHPIQIQFDDGSSVLVTDPEQHLGPYEKYHEPHPIDDLASALLQQAEALERLRDHIKERLTETNDEQSPE